MVSSKDYRGAGAGFNSFPTSGNICRLLITFANSLDPDQARRNVGPDLDPNCLTLWWYSLKDFFFFVKINLKKKSTDEKKNAKLPRMQSWIDFTGTDQWNLTVKKKKKKKNEEKKQQTTVKQEWRLVANTSNIDWQSRGKKKNTSWTTENLNKDVASATEYFLEKTLLSEWMKK